MAARINSNSTQGVKPQTPHSLKLYSINIRGLNTPEKRSQLLTSLKHSKAHIVLIQETHFRTDSIPKLQNRYFPTSIHASNIEAKSKGVTTLISNQCPFLITDTLKDPLGRYLFIKGTLHQLPYTIANIYAPNKGQVAFFKTTLQLLASFQVGTLIVGGDFNIPLTPAMDTSNGSSFLTYRALRAIKLQLHNLLLHDTWRTMHPKTRDYTYFSPPHAKYSRLDHFFISQNDLTNLTNATIEPSILSDHNPISMTLQLATTNTKTRIWRLDSSLLTDELNVNRLTKCLTDFFANNDTPDVTPLSVWNAHKCVIRGELLSISANRNKLNRSHIADLTARIHVLEQAHKASVADALLTELTQAREELLEALNKSLKRKFLLTQKLYYEFGNKSSKLLARALQSKKASHTIHKISNSAGDSFSRNEEISQQFVQYFSKLYNLTPSHHADDPSNRKTALQNFLTQYGPQPLSTDDAQSLDAPLSTEELLIALRQMKIGKSPGPDGLTACYYKSFPSILLPRLAKALNALAPSTTCSQHT